MKKNEKTLKEHLETVEYWLNRISLSNDMVIKSTDDLRMILLNLKIVSAYIDKTVGVDPVIDNLEKHVMQGHDAMKELITTGRNELRESFKAIKDELTKGEESNESM